MRLKKEWVVAVILVFFAMIHYVDRSLLSPLIPTIMNELNLNPEQIGLISTATLIVTTFGFLVWGVFYDKYSRVYLTALAGGIWSITTWLSAATRGFADFLVTRASTGIDDAATPGIYTLLSDYFPPRRRSTIMGFISMAPQAGFLLGGLLGTFFGSTLGWRPLFLLTGGLGLIGSLLVFVFVKDVPRGSSEPEFTGLPSIRTHTISKTMIMDVLKRPSLLLLSLQGFFGVFPWNVLSFWMFTYLETERFYSPELIALWLIASLTTMIIGNIVAGILGDYLFKKTKKGRVLLGAVTVYLSALFIYILFTRPIGNVGGFLGWSIVAAFIIPMAGPNVVATVFDITEPEIRSTSLSILRWFENVGSAFAPLTVGILWNRVFGVLGTASWVVSTTTWIVCGTLFLILIFRVESDIAAVRTFLLQRADTQRRTGREETESEA